MKGRHKASHFIFRAGKEIIFLSTINGLIADGDVKDMELIPLSDGEKILVVVVNNDSMKVFKIRKK